MSSSDESVTLIKQVTRLTKILDRLERRQTWSVYAQPGRFFLFSFLNGLFIVLGSTLGVALVLYLLALLGYIPVLGEIFETLRGTIATSS